MTAEIITVAEFRGLPEAETCKFALESAGLTVFLAGAEMSQADWFLAAAAVKVQVPFDQSEVASLILDEMRTRKSKTDELADGELCLACENYMTEDESHCSSCGWSYLDERAGWLVDDSSED